LSPQAVAVAALGAITALPGAPLASPGRSRAAPPCRLLFHTPTPGLVRVVGNPDPRRHADYFGPPAFS
jgi:hypothetical protein